MKYIDLKYIKIHPFIIIIFVLLIALGHVEHFFILLFTVTIHELTHVLFAIYYKLDFKYIYILPIGEVGILKGIEKIDKYKRYIIIISGPLINILCAIIIFIVQKDMNMLFISNISIGIFNIIPIYPLDGGRILYLYLANKIGVINAYNAVKKISDFICLFLLSIGIYQFFLYNYNISLISISIYVYTINKGIYKNCINDFYSNIIKKEYNMKYKTFPCKIIMANGKTNIKEIINKLELDYYILLYYNKRFISEKEMLDYYIETKGEKTIEGLLKNMED